MWGALLGSILLLLRRKWAFPVLAACFAVGAIEIVYVLWRLGLAPVFATVMAVNGVVSLSFIWYARFAAKRGILR